MKTKAKSVQVFETRLWSKEHYQIKGDNIYHGFIINSKSKEKIFFHSVADYLKAMEKMYKKSEKTARSVRGNESI